MYTPRIRATKAVAVDTRRAQATLRARQLGSSSLQEPVRTPTKTSWGEGPPSAARPPLSILSSPSIIHITTCDCTSRVNSTTRRPSASPPDVPQRPGPFESCVADQLTGWLTPVDAASQHYRYRGRNRTLQSPIGSGSPDPPGFPNPCPPRGAELLRRGNSSDKYRPNANAGHLSKPHSRRPAFRFLSPPPPFSPRASPCPCLVHRQAVAVTDAALPPSPPPPPIARPPTDCAACMAPGHALHRPPDRLTDRPLIHPSTIQDTGVRARASRAPARRRQPQE
ncbi:hypothetical protein PCL_01017 [Purpureocillium lilacinum]|uniref:Uncharacterized protein n=1 Tax=Purpureocillium lilacinum TaxID=33203 RepID=A0A2U3E4D4_PURLI|nr:hypothetical protein PCL_01017 [Purpureocillium lilacinum]